MNLNFFPIGVWWQTTANIERWVKQRGVNVLIWQNRLDGLPGDWLAMHEQVETLRAQGYALYVIRQPAYKLSPSINSDALSFDMKWKDHLLAFCLDDEFEDKQPGASLWANQQPIIDYVAKECAAYRAWMSGIPIFANVNGGHIDDRAPETLAAAQKLYTACSAAGIDILSQDFHVLSIQQKRPDGSLYFQMSDYTRGTKFLKQWTGKPCWTYLECCNQDVNQAGDPGWDFANNGLRFVGSRAPTPDEFRKLAGDAMNLRSEGLIYFPQAHGGAINDATDPALIPVMQDLGKILNPPPAITTTAPTAPPSKKLLKTIQIFDDASIEIR